MSNAAPNGARQVVVLVQDEARVLRHNSIGTEHILLGLVRENEGIAARIPRVFAGAAEAGLIFKRPRFP